MPQTNSQHFIPPLNFGLVEEELYRSGKNAVKGRMGILLTECGVVILRPISAFPGQPTILNFPFLERLNLRTIVFLAPEEPSQRLLDFIDDQDIALHHLGVSSLSSTNAWDPISEEIVLEAAELILNSNNYPLMIMCNLGRHRTGSKKEVDIMMQ